MHKHGTPSQRGPYSTPLNNPTGHQAPPSPPLTSQGARHTPSTIPDLHPQGVQTRPPLEGTLTSTTHPVVEKDLAHCVDNWGDVQFPTAAPEAILLYTNYHTVGMSVTPYA